MQDAIARAAALDIWSAPVAPKPLVGGITNANFLVEDAGKRYFVRIGDDIPVHGVMRFAERAASRAGQAAGISPAVVHAEAGVLVLDFIDGRTLDAAAVREPAMLERVVALIGRCHRDMPAHYRGPALMFWVFQVIRDYAATLADVESRMLGELPRLIAANRALETAVGPIDIVFGHNDLLAANFLDDGARLWLIDWDYGGFNSPLFDLGGLASNNELSPDQETWLLESYFEAPADDALWRRYSAMKCASLLREAMWSMASEHFSAIDFDYVAYSDNNLAAFERAYADFSQR